MQRGLFEQAPKVFGAEENLSCGSVGRQSNPELQLKHFQKMGKKEKWDITWEENLSCEWVGRQTNPLF